MAEGKNSFILYCDQIKTFSALTEQEAGFVIQWIFKYVNDQNPPMPEDRMMQFIINPIKDQLKRDLKKWDSLREKRVEAGKIGGLKSAEARASNLKQNEANASELKQEQANQAVTVNVTATVNDNVNVTETVNEILLKKEPKKKSKKIPLIDFSIPIEERKHRFSEEAFENTKYASDMITKFVRYWTEPTLDKSKMRFEIVIEKNKTWSMSGRLATWSENNFNKPQNGTGKKSVDDAVREFISE